MRIYSRRGASQIVNDEWQIREGQPVQVSVSYDPDSEGVFDVPPALHAHLMGLHIDGSKAWEDEVERFARQNAEETARRKDPATLLAAVEEGASGNPALISKLDELISLMKAQHSPVESQELHDAEQTKIDEVVQSVEPPAPTDVGQVAPEATLAPPPVTADPSPDADNGRTHVAFTNLPTAPATSSSGASALTVE